MASLGHRRGFSSPQFQSYSVSKLGRAACPHIWFARRKGANGLTKIRVENFKCIEDSDEVTIGDRTCLVGKNESGKTALLEARYKLNPVIASEGRFEKREFPRRAWDDFGTNARALTTTWELDGDDVAAVEEKLGVGCVASTEVVVAKGYSNRQRWTIPLDQSAIVQSFKEKIELTAGAIERLSGVTSVAELAAAVGPAIPPGHNCDSCIPGRFRLARNISTPRTDSTV